jgi:glutathione S-transferase
MMKLFHAANSPFARKVMACAIARGIDNRIELIATSPRESPELAKMNPLAKIPCLVTEDGTAIFDSPVICEYLDSVGEANGLFPSSGTPRWVRIQVMHALADGIADALVLRRQIASSGPADDGRRGFETRLKASVDRGLAKLEADPPKGLSDIGAIAVACALGYMELRFPEERWRETHPRLAAWLAEASRLPPLARTAPQG